MLEIQSYQNDVLFEYRMYHEFKLCTLDSSVFLPNDYVVWVVGCNLPFCIQTLRSADNHF